MEHKKLDNICIETLRSMHAYASARLTSSALAGVPEETLRVHRLYLNQLEAAISKKNYVPARNEGVGDHQAAA